jgi:DNA-binding transcriptional LysR family regulator
MIDKLEYLLALARQRHFGRAADACGVTQPTLSAGLKQLEAQLGVLLVQRGSRYQGLTPEGERVLEWAQRIVGDVRQMRQEVGNLRQGLTGHLRIAAIPTALAMMPKLTNPFRERHPGVRFSIFSRTSTEVLRMIESLEVEAGLSYVDDTPLKRMRAIPLYEERYCLLAAADSPLAGETSVTWSDLGQIPLALLTSDMQNRRIIDRKLQEAGTEAWTTLESNSMLVLFAHVRTGKWASIMPEVLVPTLALGDVVRSIPIREPEAVHTVGLIVPEREPLPAVTEALLGVMARQEGAVKKAMAPA